MGNNSRRGPTGVLSAVAMLSVLLSALSSVTPARAAAQSQTQRIAAVASKSAPGALSRVSINVDNALVHVVVQSIADQAGLRVSYDRTIIPQHARVTVRMDNVAADEAFQRVLQGTGLVAEIRRSGNVLIFPAVAEAQSGVIIGKVTQAKTNQAVVGATVSLDDATKGVLTGGDGTFRLSVTPGSHRITVRALGFVKRTQTATAVEGQSVTVDFQLTSSASVLDEVVVTGSIVATERREIPTPITVLTADDIEKRGITRLEDIFRGSVPGVVTLDRGTDAYTSNGLGVMQTSRIYSRGTADLNGGTNPPKVYVDGVEMVNSSYLGTIDPKSIERIEIVTGPQAATLYGSGSMGGVMQIFTKKGSGRSAPEVTLSLQYGTLQSNISPARTPVHSENLGVAGGLGATGTYAGNISYSYTGQWRPYLFARTLGVSIGGALVQGPLTVTGSVNVTDGANGTYSIYSYPLFAADVETGVAGLSLKQEDVSGTRSLSKSKTLSLGVTHRTSQWLQQNLTVGQSFTNFALEPQRPGFRTTDDTISTYQGSNGQRTSLNYDLSFAPAKLGIISTTMTLGMSGSLGEEMQWNGQSQNYQLRGLSNPTVNPSLDDRHWGAFGQWRIGLFDKLYTTMGIRAERNPSYGSGVKIDWTPTNGLAYTIDVGDVSVKLLGSYGKATRAPTPQMKSTSLGYIDVWEPSWFAGQIANPDLTPEYSRGPQGGVELYYGNLGSLTVNHYNQKVTDLIQQVVVDSLYRTLKTTGTGRYWQVNQYRNIASIRQMGWDFTSATNVGPLNVRTTYSWTKVTVLKYAPGVFQWRAGQFYVPSHTGNLTLGYARGGTSATLSNDWIGAYLVESSYASQYRSPYAVATLVRLRLGAYDGDRVIGVGPQDATMPGYWRSNFTFSQRLTTQASVTLNVNNLTNSFRSDEWAFKPTLGRRTQLGLSIRRR